MLNQVICSVRNDSYYMLRTFGHSSLIRNSKFEIRNFRHGFTLVEALLVLGIFGVLAGLTIPLVASLPATTNLQTAAEGLASQARRAQARAVAGWNGRAWGVAFFADRYTVFAGSSFAARDPLEDEETILPATVSLTSALGSEVSFSPAGLPSAAGDLTLAGADGLVAVVSLGASGVIEQQ